MDTYGYFYVTALELATNKTTTKESKIGFFTSCVTVVTVVTVTCELSLFSSVAGLLYKRFIVAFLHITKY